MKRQDSIIHILTSRSFRQKKRTQYRGRFRDSSDSHDVYHAAHSGHEHGKKSDGNVSAPVRNFGSCHGERYYR